MEQQLNAPRVDDAMAAPVEEEGMESGVQQAGPEEQQTYERVVSQALNLIYDRAALPQILKMLAGSGDPMEGLARATVLVISRIGQGAEEAGVKLTSDIMFHATKEVFEDLANLAKEAKIKDFEADPEAFEGAFFRALDELRILLAQAGRINQQASQQDMAKLEQMDQSGELEAMFTRLSAADKNAKPAKKSRPTTRPKAEPAVEPAMEEGA